MNYKEQIEQKAREYVKTLVTDPGLQEYEEIMGDFKAGAEAAIEIANEWIPVKEQFPKIDAEIPINIKRIHLPKSVDTVYCNESSLHTVFGELGFTHWKPITL